MLKPLLEKYKIEYNTLGSKGNIIDNNQSKDPLWIWFLWNKKHKISKSIQLLWMNVHEKNIYIYGM